MPHPHTDDSEPPAPPCPCTEELLPLAQSPVPHALRRKLLAAWKALRHVCVLNEEAAVNVLPILACTLPDPFADLRTVGPLELDDPPPQARPTAAHPRAFRGTVYKPPKFRQPRTFDLAPHLCVQADEARILTRLAPFYAAAMKRVTAQWPEDAFEAVRAHASSALRPYGQSWSREAAARIPTLPPGLRRYMLHSQRGRSWHQLARLLELWWGLDLEHDADLRLCVALALNRRPEPECLEWCATAMHIPPARRVQYMELLLETGAYQCRPAAALAAQVVEADQLCSDKVWRRRMYAVFQAVAGGHGLDYLLDGFRLANECDYEPFSLPTKGPPGTAAVIRPWAAHIAKGSSRPFFKYWAIARWQDCAKFDGLLDVLSRVRPDQLDPDTAQEFIPSLLKDLEDDDEKSAEKWHWAAAHAQFFVERLVGLRQDYRRKFLKFQQELQWHFCAASLDDLLPDFSVHALRLCSPPFRARGHSACAFIALLALAREEPRVLGETGNATWEELESATFRRNDGFLIGAGLHTLADCAGTLTAQGWRDAPRAVLRTARVLGSFHWAARTAFVQSFVKDPACSLNPAVADWPAIWRCVRPQIEAGVPSPLSARLRAHLEGERTLTPAQLARDRTLLGSKWSMFQFEALRQRALAELARGLDSPCLRDPAVEHALRMQPAGDQNRRALRQLLRQRFAGRPDYANRHPLNRRWLAAHPRLDADVWTRGISLRGEIAGRGPVDLSLEPDPLEVLRMGSYFGTCLGLGGIYTHSAAAVALDVNKQVVYARTPEGRVIARQLLAISEADQLVCYKVYPENAARDVRKLFRDYDQRLAGKLGLPTFDATDDDQEYEIRTILSHDFWDDGAWNWRSHAGNKR